MDTLKTDIRIVSPRCNFGSSSKSRTVHEINPQQNHSQQDETYAQALSICKRLGHSRIVITGCGIDEPMVASFGSSCRELFVIDISQPLSARPSALPGPKRLKCNLSSTSDIETQFQRFDDDTPQLFIFYDVLEHLIDPRVALKAVRKILKRNSLNRLLVCSVEREGLRDDQSFKSLPKNRAHVREWTGPEMERFLLSCGFKVENIGKSIKGRVEFELSCSEAFYESFLKSNNLPPMSERLIITTEHAKTSVTGGIGTHIDQMERIFEKPLLIMFIGKLGLDHNNSNLPKENMWLYPELLLFEPRQESCNNAIHRDDIPNMVLECVLQTLFFYDNVLIIECQDYLGIGCRVVQAKAAGMISSHISVEVVACGNHSHLEEISGHWFEFELQPTFLKEKISLEGADYVRFPTQHIERLQNLLGYNIQPHRKIIMRYPFRFGPESPIPITNIDTLIFFGKRTRMKGFPEFVAALKILNETGVLADISHLILIGPKDISLKEDNEFIDEIRIHLNVEEHNLKRCDALRMIKDLAPRSLCITPYKGDSHSFTTLEAIDLNCQLVAFRAGGIPEVIPSEFHDEVLCDPTGIDLANHIRTALKYTVKERQDLVRNLRKACVAAQEKINDRFVNLDYGGGGDQGYKDLSLSPEMVSVIVTCFNTDLGYIQELIFGLNNQTLVPKEVIFVDDGSAVGYTDNLAQVVKSNLKLPFRIVHHERNLGLARARNTGLEMVTTRYVVIHDSDDIMLNDFIFDSVSCLEKNSNVFACTCYYELFNDGESWEENDFTRPIYAPFGQASILGQLNNLIFGALATFRTDSLRAIGGWDTTDNSMWEDWALGLKICGMRGIIMVIPKIEFLVRVRSDSTVRTYPQFPAERRLARNSAGTLSTFDAYMLQRILRNYDQPRSKYEEIKSKYEEIKSKYEGVLNRPSYRATLKLVRILDRAPNLKLLLYKSLKGSWRIFKKIRSITNVRGYLRR